MKTLWVVAIALMCTVALKLCAELYQPLAEADRQKLENGKQYTLRTTGDRGVGTSINRTVIVPGSWASFLIRVEGVAGGQ